MNSSVICAALCALLVVGSAKCRGAQLKVEATDFNQRVIYHSPDTRGYTSWVGLWQMPNGAIQRDFTQITGPTDAPVWNAPILQSTDSGATWTVVNPDLPATPVVNSIACPGYFNMAPNSCRGMSVSADGKIMVRPVWNPSGVAGDCDGHVQRSIDGGKTWSSPIYFLPREQYKTLPTLIKPLRDGRLVLFAGCWKRGDDQNPGGVGNNLTKTVFISSDKGKSWSKPIIVVPLDAGDCEESDFCELPNGDLFFVHRACHLPDHKTDRSTSPLVAPMGPNPPQSYWYSDRMQSIAKKSGKTFIPGPVSPAPFPHSGYPLLIQTQDGLILHCATDGIYCTANVGQTWTKLDIAGTGYYPKGMQLKDGKIIIIGHVGSDDVYGAVDQSIYQQSFKLRMTAE